MLSFLYEKSYDHLVNFLWVSVLIWWNAFGHVQPDVYILFFIWTKNKQGFFLMSFLFIPFWLCLAIVAFLLLIYLFKQPQEQEGSLIRLERQDLES